MNKRLEKTIESGIPYEFIVEYFSQISSFNDGNNYFYGDNWEIKVVKMNPRKLGSIELPVTLVTFKAEKPQCENLMSDFFLKFLSAGG